MATYKAMILKSKIHTKNDGTSNIKIRITHNRKVDYISTNLFINPNVMDKVQGVPNSGRNMDFINLRITDYLYKYRKKDIELGDKRLFMSVSNLKQHLLNGKTSENQIDFFEFISEFRFKTKRYYQFELNLKHLI